MVRAARDWYVDPKTGDRVHITTTADAPPFTLRRVYINSGGYDSGGAYWGLGDPLYYYEGPISDINGYVRGATRDEAKMEIRKNHPHARFYR